MAKIGKTSKIWSKNDMDWYYELRFINPYREYQYDKTIQFHLNILFPEYICIPFNKVIRQEGNDNGSRPDFAMIRPDYSEWWIVEVERAEDNLDHVYEQIGNFTDGEYEEFEIAEHIVKENASLKFDKIVHMLSYLDVNVMVLVDRLTDRWKKKLDEYEPSYCELREYRDSKGNYLFSLTGDYPYIIEAYTHCHVDDAMKNVVRITEPNFFNSPKPKENVLVQLFNALFGKSVDEDILTILLDGKKSEWKLISVKNDKYIQPITPDISLRANDAYTLSRTSSREYLLQLN